MIYFIQAGTTGPIKIGYSNDPKNRCHTLGMAWYEELYVLAAVRGSLLTERDFHVRFAASHIRGEWFHPSPELMAFIGTLEPYDSPTTAYNRKKVKGRPQWSVDIIDKVAGHDPDARRVLETLGEAALFRVESCYDEKYHGTAPSISKRMANARRHGVKGCKIWRKLIRLGDAPPFQDNLRRRQMHLAQVREWRRTGVEPRGIPGAWPLPMKKRA